MSDVGLEVVQHLYRAMKIDPKWSEESHRGFVWWGHRLAQKVWAEPCFEDVGISIARIHARTDLVTGFTGKEEQLLTLAPLLGQASLNGIIQDPVQPERLQLACSVYVHAQTFEWLKYVMALAAIMQVGEAKFLAQDLASQLGATVAASSHPRSGPRPEPDDMLGFLGTCFIEGQQPSRFRGEEMLLAREMMEQGPFLANGDEIGMTAEFPFGQLTSLLRALTRESHPRLGNGLLMRLSLPIDLEDFSEARVVEWAIALNKRELEQLTRTHFLGSWCGSPWGLSYVSFFPNSLARCGPHLTPTLAMGMWSRAQYGNVRGIPHCAWLRVLPFREEEAQSLFFLGPPVNRSFGEPSSMPKYRHTRAAAGRVSVRSPRRNRESCPSLTPVRRPNSLSERPLVRMAFCS